MPKLLPKSLTGAQIAQYREQGFLSPIGVMGEDEALALRATLESIEAGMGGPLRGDLRHKTHLLFPFLADLVRHPKILDAIEDLLGPDILCWSSNFFIKEASRRRPIPPSCRGTRIRPIGGSPPRMSRPPGWR